MLSLGAGNHKFGKGAQRGFLSTMLSGMKGDEQCRRRDGLHQSRERKCIPQSRHQASYMTRSSPEATRMDTGGTERDLSPKGQHHRAVREGLIQTQQLI